MQLRLLHECSDLFGAIGLALNLDYRVSYHFAVILHDKKLLLLLAGIQHVNLSLTLSHYDSNFSMVQVKRVLDKCDCKETFLILDRHDLNQRGVPGVPLPFVVYDRLEARLLLDIIREIIPELHRMNRFLLRVLLLVYLNVFMSDFRLDFIDLTQVAFLNQFVALCVILRLLLFIRLLNVVVYF